MPTTMQLISAQTLTSATGSVTFSSIPQTFTDVKVVLSSRFSSAINNINLSLNGSTSNFSRRTLDGDGSSAASYGGNDNFMVSSVSSSNTANTFGNAEVYIPNYTSSNYKSISVDGVAENNATQSYSDLNAMLWSNTAAITSITFTPSSGNFVAGSSFYLYGISSDTTNQNTSGPYAFGGDTITTDGTYWYHTFLNSNSFTPQKNLSNVDFLVVAGGGSGGMVGGGGSGGGGAGGARSSVTWTGGNSIGNNLESKLTLTANTPYACVIGAGGAVPSGLGNNGSNSSFSGGSITAVTSTGGGGGGNSYGTSAAAGNGGSGGGGGYAGGSGTSYTGTGTSGQGFDGGTGTKSGSNRTLGGGGGGASAAGANATTTVGGAGGTGIYTALTNAVLLGELSSSNYYVAGGGGGNCEDSGSSPGTGGTGGGGAGGDGTSYGNGDGTNATANTGGGGGGGWYTAGSGGSGVIIVRYAV